jgi:DNA-binding LytR/AlgR family response regulator
MKILIVEDDLLLAIHLESIVEKLGYQVIASVPDFAQAITVLANQQVDFALLDIELAGAENGLDVGEKLHALQIPFIIATNHGKDDYYNRVKQMTNCLFLAKPINIYTLDSSIKLLLQSAEKPTKFLKDGVRGPLIVVKDILFINVVGTYSYIFTAKKRYVFKKSLKSIKAQLPLDDFLQIHSSYLVQKKFIKQIDKEKNIVEVEGHTLPISRRFKKELTTQL